MNTKIALFSALVLSSLLTACAAPGTRVSTDSNFYKDSARNQEAWCSQFGCGCSLNGAPATCSLVSTCLSTNSCQQASR